MRMDDMVIDLETRGFAAKRKYIPEEKCYLFTISKDGIQIQEKWSWPDTTDSKKIDESQRNFLRTLVVKWEWEIACSHYDKAIANVVIEPKLSTRPVKHSLKDLETACIKFDERYGDWPRTNPYVNSAFVSYCEEDVKNTMELCNFVNKQLGFGTGKVAIKNVHFNPPMTIVIWTDGTKTFVKAHNELFDPEKGLAMAIAKKFIGDNKYDYIEEINKWVDSKMGPRPKGVPIIPKINIDSTAFSRAMQDIQDAAKRAGAEVHRATSSWEVSNSLYWDDCTLRCRHCGLTIIGKKGVKQPQYCPGCNSFMESKDCDS